MRTDISEEELKVFLEELDEQVQGFEEDLLKLEKEPENSDLISKIFRYAHTLKGSSAAFGHDAIAKLAHTMENLLSKLRNKEMNLTTEVMNILLEGLDILKHLKLNFENQEDKEIDIGTFAKRINKICEGKKEGAEIEEKIEKEEIENGKIENMKIENMKIESMKIESMKMENMKIEEKEKKEAISISDDDIERIITENEKFKIYKIFVKIMTQSKEISVRNTQIFCYLSEMGKIHKSKPTFEDVENEKVDENVNIIFISEKGKEEIEEILNIIPELEKVDVQSIKEMKAIEVRRTEIVKKESEENELIEKESRNVSKKAISPKSGTVTRSIRMDVEKLDKLIDYIGELVIDRTRLIQLETDLESKLENDPTILSNINQTFEHLEKVITELHREILKTRLLSVDVIFNKFPRMVRDLSIKSGKKINFEIYGEETELDRQIIDQIVDPLTHILRNSVDHGIEEPAERIKKGKAEEGNIILSARHQEDHISITVEDDGKGIDLEKVKEKAIKLELVSKNSIDKLTDKEVFDFIFLPGFSTREVAGEVSGRGVGMDIVKSNIEKVNGSIIIDTKKDKGTKMTIKLPITLAIVNSLLTRLGDGLFAFPLFSVLETLMIKKEDVKTIRKNESIDLRGEILPVIKLREIFQLGDAPDVDSEYLWVIVVSWTDRKAGFIVDSLIGEQAIVIKALSSLIGKVQGISGATVLGSGDVALVLDIAGLINIVIEERLKLQYE